MLPSLPLYIEGEVVKGFGRGSKELGCPTANYSLEVVKRMPKNVIPGVYYGWAQVDSGAVYKMVANVGWCPFYQNKEMSVETHLMHEFDSDFYGSNLKIVLVGYLRDELNFDSQGSLIAQINEDIQNADQKLDLPEAKEIKNQYFYKKAD
ncbi:putative riboflavin kinase [Hyposmocoma kahamanoa]|uniref:putative riboflavin kinase n=1 Tax=Hyposmocoma kahamanoa TaxID=1477025 RepID=UPI000E6D6446|nr:putative riboflavin kinase [Hyposmocoma kahamanoa]